LFFGGFAFSFLLMAGRVWQVFMAEVAFCRFDIVVGTAKRAFLGKHLPLL
jgi:hypothetical protein